MTVLALRMSRHRNAVSALHARVSKAMWRGLWPDRPQHEVPIHYITNAVHLDTWLPPEVAGLYDRSLGPGWKERMDDPQTWASVEDIADADLWEMHQLLRMRLVNCVRQEAYRQARLGGEPDPPCEAMRHCLDASVLTIGFARRFAGHKRPYLPLQDRDWLDWVVNRNPRGRVQFVFAGKAHPNDFRAKQVLQRVDVWLNVPRRPLEACGTSGQKAAMNAGLNLSTLDGGSDEAYDGTNGLAIGRGGEHSDWDLRTTSTPRPFSRPWRSTWSRLSTTATRTTFPGAGCTCSAAPCERSCGDSAAGGCSSTTPSASTCPPSEA